MSERSELELDPEDYRRAMRHLAAAATIVATLRDGAPAGLLATAVCSVSLAPPTLLACINRASRSFDAITESGVFCVNVLERAHGDFARQFLSRAGAARFAIGTWARLVTGAPALEGALAVFDCRVARAFPAETHMILLGRVLATRVLAEGEPLLYYDGAYTALEPAADVVAD